MKTYAKFATLVAVIVGTLFWLAAGSINDSKTYYKTLAEVTAMGQQAHGKNLRVGGKIEAHSIVRSGKQVEFVMAAEQQKMKVVYRGTDPLPDTFRDGAEALADGKLQADGSFEANHIQAKCASKYAEKVNPKGAVPTASGRI